LEKIKKNEDERKYTYDEKSDQKSNNIYQNYISITTDIHLCMNALKSK